jgi:hypothetical protein
MSTSHSRFTARIEGPREYSRNGSVTSKRNKSDAISTDKRTKPKIVSFAKCAPLLGGTMPSLRWSLLIRLLYTLTVIAGGAGAQSVRSDEVPLDGTSQHVALSSGWQRVSVSQGGFQTMGLRYKGEPAFEINARQNDKNPGSYRMGLPSLKNITRESLWLTRRRNLLQSFLVSTLEESLHGNGLRESLWEGVARLHDDFLVWRNESPTCTKVTSGGASFGFGHNLERSSSGECGAVCIGGAPHFLLSTGKSKIARNSRKEIARPKCER